MKVEPYEGNLCLRIPQGHFYHAIAESMPKRRKHPAKGIWVFPPWLQVMAFVKKHMPNLEWQPEAEALWLKAVEAEGYRAKVSAGQIDFDQIEAGGPFRLPPYRHQRIAMVMGRDQPVFAYLMDQGTGKTKVILDDAAHNYRAGRIDALLVICPNSVKTNWVNPDPDPGEPDEVDKHIAPDIPYCKAAYFTSQTKAQREAIIKFNDSLVKNSSSLMILSMNVEGIWTTKALAYAQAFVRGRRCMIVVDESTRIGNRTSKRTKAVMDLRKGCPVARIASGTPVIKSPLKAYSQFGFLDQDIIGIPTYAEFSARYAITVGDQRDRHAVRFVNTDELADKIAGVSYRVLKEDCLDLPPKVYQKRKVYMTKEMEWAYKEMRDESIVWLDGLHRVEATTAFVALGRLQQITAGYLPVLDPVTREQTGVKKLGSGMPPKVEEALDIIEECDGKVIVWCRYKFEITEMLEALKVAGIEAVAFHGGVSETARVEARQRFQTDPSVKAFVGQVNAGGIGITLHAASTVIYLSNTFSTEDRVQSEDRAHRIGQTKSVNYYDLVIPRTVDERVLSVLRANKKVSDEVMRDGYRAWI